MKKKPENINKMPVFSRLIAGTMLWGKWGKDMSKKKRTALIETAYSLGITSFDHADIYGDYTTEKDFGKAFLHSKISRNKVQFISKCGIGMVCSQRPYQTKHYNYRAPYIIESVNASLRNLGTDYLDVLLLHRPSPLLQPEEVAKAVDTLKHSGKILSFGVSNFLPSQLGILKKYVPVSINQIEVSLTHSQPMFDGQLDYCQESQILPMSWGSMGLLKQDQSSWPTKLKAAMATLCEKFDADFAPIAIAWLLKHPARIHPLIGTTNLTRLEEITKARAINFSEEDWFFLLEAANGKPCP